MLSRLRRRRSARRSPRGRSAERVARSVRRLGGTLPTTQTSPVSAFVAVLVVASEPGHQCLRARRVGRDRSREPLSLRAAQRRRELTVVTNDDVTGSPLLPGESGRLTHEPSLLDSPSAAGTTSGEKASGYTSDGRLTCVVVLARSSSAYSTMWGQCSRIHWRRACCWSTAVSRSSSTSVRAS